MRNTLMLLAGVALVMASCKKEDNCTSNIWYQDADADGKGNAYVKIEGGCEAPSGYVSNDDDNIDKTVPSTQRALLPYVGATWCPPCGEYGEETKEYISDNFSKDQAIVLSCQRNDLISTNFSTSLGGEFLTYHSATGIPSMFSRGAGEEDIFYPSSSSASSRINSIISKNATVGITAVARMSGDKVNIVAAGRFLSASSEEHSVSAYLLEDDVRADQKHSTLGTVADMPHNSVVRANASTSYLGESLGNSFLQGQGFEQSFFHTG